MPTMIDQLNIKVVVRRVAVGATPFTWEIHGPTGVASYVSPDRFRGMEAAYRAGQARLAELVQAKRAKRKQVAETKYPALALADTRDESVDEDGVDEIHEDINPDLYDASHLRHNPQSNSGSHAVDLERAALSAFTGFAVSNATKAAQTQA